VAREFGGGGHPQAAGFSTATPYADLVSRLRSLVHEQLAAR
jgi:nanoRNase/pAp phosphatase (c-di-AMP/oligoRNAs hydrolase)